MASSGNFSTWNPLRYSSISGIAYSEGNCKVQTPASGYPVVMNNFAPKTGKWYVEFYNHYNAGYNVLGIVQQESITKYGNWLPYDVTGKSMLYFSHNGNIGSESPNSNLSYGSSWGSGNQIIGCALDLDNGKVWWSLNGTFQNSGDPAAGTNAAFDNLITTDGFFMAFSDYNNGATGTMGINCGQDSSWGGAKTSGSANATDGNGFGDFYYTPPTGFLAMCSANLPTSSDIDPGGDNGADENPTKQFNAVAYTGTGSARSVTGFNFQPDMVWIKNRASPGNQAPRIVDSNRGVSKAMIPSDTQPENTETTAIQSFDTDGFTLGSVLGGYNTSSATYIAWGWRANGGTTSSNSNGDITSTVQANTNAGFSIVTYTGDNTDHRSVGYGSANIGHGLNSAPEFLITKRTNATASWYTLHASAGVGYFTLDGTGAFTSGAVPFGPALPTTTTFGAYSANNNSGATYINYCWHSVEGFQKFGTYTGNGNADGPFIYTGFRPRMIFVKKSSSTGHWTVTDTERNTNNVMQKVIDWDADYAEYGTGSRDFDVYSNGFKIRTSDNETNHSGQTFVYGAWADVPAKYNNAF